MLISSRAGTSSVDTVKPPGKINRRPSSPAHLAAYGGTPAVVLGSGPIVPPLGARDALKDFARKSLRGKAFVPDPCSSGCGSPVARFDLGVPETWSDQAIRGGRYWDRTSTHRRMFRVPYLVV